MIKKIILSISISIFYNILAMESAENIAVLDLDVPVNSNDKGKDKINEIEFDNVSVDLKGIYVKSSEEITESLSPKSIIEQEIPNKKFRIFYYKSPRDTDGKKLKKKIYKKNLKRALENSEFFKQNSEFYESLLYNIDGFHIKSRRKLKSFIEVELNDLNNCISARDNNIKRELIKRLNLISKRQNIFFLINACLISLIVVAVIGQTTFLILFY